MEAYKGTIVTVYQDPITEQHREGDARLIRPLEGVEDEGELGRFQRWLVRFVGDHDNVERVIRV